MTSVPAANPAPRLERETFRTSRVTDVCTEKGLVADTGHPKPEWPLVVFKELVDNAVDVCEEFGVAPVIEIVVATALGEITVIDNGRGIPTETITSILDYTMRTSSRALYPGPSRGRQGNALGTVCAMGFVLDGERGVTIIEADGQAHRITFALDPISGAPWITCDIAESLVKNGTKITTRWPSAGLPLLDSAKGLFLQGVCEYVGLNPHLSITVDWDGVRGGFAATALDWQKWLPSDPLPAHWYDAAHFERCIAARIGRDKDRGLDRPVREFLAEFRGLSATSKQKTILEEIGAARLPLSQIFWDPAGNVHHAGMAKLLHAMQRESRPAKAQELGLIGRDHLLQRSVAYGAQAESFRYERFLGESSASPFVIEAAFAVCPGGAGRSIFAGVNFSPAIGDPFRLLGRHRSLDDVLTMRSCDSRAPIILYLHYAGPHVAFADRGKAALVLHDDHADALVETVKAVTGPWHKQHLATARAQERDAHRLMQQYLSGEAERKRAAAERRRAERDKDRESTADVVGTGKLHRVIALAAEAADLPLTALSVLHNDPYRQDTHIGRIRGLWFKEQIDRYRPVGQIHLRSLHYILSSVGGVTKPDNKAAYINSFKHWRWLHEHAAKAARWLQDVPFDRIVDHRNDPPVLIVPTPTKANPYGAIDYTLDTTVLIPRLPDLLPRARCQGLAAPQPFRIIIFGEKSSLRDELEPLARQIGAELLLPTGEISDTLIAEMAARAAADGRPAVVLYVADFDPSGFQMPISVARKLQALRDLLYPNLQIQVHRIALTLDQVRHFDLPSTPLKKTELRRAKWRVRMGREQSEIDALIALHPMALRQIVLEAAAPFWDPGLANRVANAEIAWQNRVNLLIAEHPAHARALADIEKERHGVIEAARKLEGAKRRAIAKLSDVDLPPVPDAIEPEIVAEAPEPLFSSNDDFVTTTLKLRAEKSLGDEGGA